MPRAAEHARSRTYIKRARVYDAYCPNSCRSAFSADSSAVRAAASCDELLAEAVLAGFTMSVAESETVLPEDVVQVMVVTVVPIHAVVIGAPRPSYVVGTA